MDTTELNKDLKTPLDNFYHWEKTDPHRVFLRQPEGSNWLELSYAQAGTEARKMLKVLREKGMQKGDHIGIYSKNCYHWIIADIAIMMGGMVSVPFYASTPRKQLQEIIEKSDIKLLFIGKLDEWGDRKEAISESLKVIRFPHYKGNALVEVGDDWTDLMANVSPDYDTITPGLNDLWTILFTSGTTGSPKGVMHSYRAPALIISGEKLTNFIGIFKTDRPRHISYLPLNHVGERIGIEINCLATGGSISFGESIDTFAKNLQSVQPTMFFSVPRIWNKFYQGVIARLSQKKLNLLFKIPVINNIVKNKIKFGLGLSQANIVATGAALTPQHLKQWFKVLDIHLIESYGMTEACGSITNGVDPDTPMDSVGKAVPFCEIKIDESSGEILMKTPHCMLGYYKEPELTAKVIRDGWIHSGDKGRIDENGYLYLEGRVSDTFKSTKGKFIVPAPIEEILSTSTLLEQVAVVGHNVPQPIALANLSEEGLKLTADEVESDLSDLIKHTNEQLMAFQKISTLVIITETWTELNQLLTPTMKVRRAKLHEKYEKHYVAWHEHKHPVIWHKNEN